MKKRKASKKIIDEIYPEFSERSQRGRRNRQNGKTWEREVAQKLRALWPGAKRTFGQAREGHEVPDIAGTPFWIEAGKGGTLTIYEKLAQGLRDSESSPNAQYGGARTLVIMRHPSSRAVSVTMELGEFLDLMKELKYTR